MVNDDFERQARHTSSSLEDLESKFNVGIERAVMMEEEIKIGEQEREGLRIETQRLRDELGDLKIEADILQDKLKRQQENKENRHLPILSAGITAPNTPSFAREHSPDSIGSSSLMNTPLDTKSVSTNDTISETPTPPSPPISDRSSKAVKPFLTPLNSQSRIRTPSGDLSTTPKPTRYGSTKALRSSRGPSVAPVPKRSTPSINSTSSRVRTSLTTRGLPNSASLTHIRSLTTQIQRLEQRVQSARSKLPAPVNTPPRASPRSMSVTGVSYMPASVTIRSRKRTGGSTISGTSSTGVTDDTPNQATKQVSRISTSGISRLSFGPVATRAGSHGESDSSQPSSGANATFARPERSVSRSEAARPASRTSMSGTRARTPIGHYSQSTVAESRRPRSSVGGSVTSSHGHGHSQSVSQIDLDEYREFDLNGEAATPSRRATVSKGEAEEGGVRCPASGLPRRQSGGVSAIPKTPGRKMSHSLLKEGEGGREGGREVERKRSEASLVGAGAMKPPARARRLSGVGESY